MRFLCGSVARDGLSERKRPLWVFWVLVSILALSCPLLSEKAFADTVSRWMAPYWVEVPASWKPLVDRREGVMFFTGAPPDSIGSPQEEGRSILAVGVMRQAPPPGMGYEALLESFEKEISREKPKNFTSSRKEISLGSVPAVYVSFSGEVELEGASRKVGGNFILTKETDGEGNLTLVMVMGNASGLEEHKEELETLLSSAREGEPPLKLEKSFPYGATQEAFRHTFGLAWASDGVFALGDSTNCKIRLFDAEGTLLEEWGKKGKGEEGSFSYPQGMAFAPDGSLWVVEEGYSVRARVQRFSRKGELLQKIELSPKIVGEKGIYKPPFVGITDSGKIVISGLTDITDGEYRVLVFAPSGDLLASWEPGETGGMAVLPGDRLVLLQENPETDRNPLFCVYDLQGKKLAQWPFYGAGFSPTPGDRDVYFNPKAMASDEAGNIYVYDDSEDALWIYDGEGRFFQALPVREHFGIFLDMAASPGGHVVVQDRPGSYGPGEPSLHIMKNTCISSSSKPSEITPEPEPKSENVLGEEGLRAELERLKKALALREEALALERGGDLYGAIAKYRESLPFSPDPAVEAYVAELEQELEKGKEVASKAPEKALEAAQAPEPEKDAEVSGEAPGASEKPAISLESLLPEPPAPPELPELTEASPPASPYDEAKKLEFEGRRYEALLKYEEVLRENPDPAMQAHVRELESLLRREARQVVTQAVAVQNRGEYHEALRLYRESLVIFPLEQVKDYADRLEILLHQGAQSQDARAKAEALWREGAELQKNWRYQEALKKYKEGLALSPDPKMEEHVKKLEAFLKGRETPSP